MTETVEQNKDTNTRTIVLIYGLTEDGTQFWIYAAVKPSKYAAFMADQKAGTLDLYKFTPYGEIIVSGKGKSPPDEITLKVAEMYQTDPATLFVPTETQGNVPEEMKVKKEE
jgi:hypothetical protein